MWGHTTLVLLFCSFHGGENSEYFFDKPKDQVPTCPFNDESLIVCIINLTQIALTFTPSVLLLSNEEDNLDDIYFTKIIAAFANRDVPIVIQDQNNYETNQYLDVYDGNVIVVVHLDSCDELLKFYIGNVDQRVKHLIVISEETKEDFLALQTVERRFIERDVTFIVHNPKAKRHSLITFLPRYDGKTCKSIDKLAPTQINVCSNGSLETDAVFPDSIKFDFKNCTLKVGMASMYPFSRIANRDKLKNYDLIPEINGSDVELVKIICNYFNASPVWYYLHRPEENPFRDMDHARFMENGSFDICAGGLYRIYGDIMVYSGIYTRQAVIWIYRAHRTIRSWANLVHKLTGLYLFYSFYMCFSLLMYFFRKYDCQRLPLEDILLYSWGSLIGGGSLPVPTSLKHKILNIFYLVLSIYLATYMNLQLVSFLTIEGPSINFKTNDEIIESGRTPYLNHESKDFTEDKNYIAFANKSVNCANFYNCSRMALHNDGITVILDEYFYPLQARTAIKDEAYVLRTGDNLVTIYQEMMINKHSPITVTFQKVLSKLFESGICEHLFEEAIGITVVAKAKSANKNALSNNYSCESGCAITLAQMAGVFYLWVFGCCLSLCVFLLEIRWTRRRGEFKVK